MCGKQRSVLLPKCVDSRTFKNHVTIIHIASCFLWQIVAAVGNVFWSHADSQALCLWLFTGGFKLQARAVVHCNTCCGQAYQRSEHLRVEKARASREGCYASEASSPLHILTWTSARLMMAQAEHAHHLETPVTPVVRTFVQLLCCVGKVPLWTRQDSFPSGGTGWSLLGKHASLHRSWTTPGSQQATR